VVEHGGVATDIIDASWQAIVDSITYKLFKDERPSTEGLNQGMRSEAHLEALFPRPTGMTVPTALRGQTVGTLESLALENGGKKQALDKLFDRHPRKLSCSRSLAILSLIPLAPR